MTLKWLGIVLVGGTIGFGVGVQSVTAKPQSSNALGAPLSVVEGNPYDSWTAIDSKRSGAIAYQSARTWELRANSQSTDESFGDPTLDGIYDFVQQIPVQIDMGGALIPDIFQAEW